MGDSDFRERFADRAVVVERERFSTGRIATMYEELFEKIVK